MPTLSAVDISNLFAQYLETCRGKQADEVREVLNQYFHTLIHGTFADAAAEDAKSYTFNVVMLAFSHPVGGNPILHYPEGKSQDWGIAFTVAHNGEDIDMTLRELLNDQNNFALLLEESYGGNYGLPLGMDLVAVQTSSHRKNVCHVTLVVACRPTLGALQSPQQKDYVPLTITSKGLFDNRHPFVVRRAAARVFSQLID